MFVDMSPGENTIFQCDNASIHRDKVGTDGHQGHSNEAEHPRWPPKSTDLNIIKYLW